MSSRIQRLRPVLVWAGFILALATSVALMWFALWAPGLEWPRVPDRQHPGENYGFSLARGVGCDAITINSLTVSDRKRRVDECAQHEGQLRFDQENLNQAVRTTNAAEESIRVSYQQTRIAYVQSAVTVLALLFTGVAAWAAASAARTANRALSHAEAASRDELRAYVHIDRTELRWGSPGGGAPSITLFAKNTGQTPAKWFGAQTTIVLGPIEGDNPLPLADLHQTDRKLHRWSALGGGTELSFSGASAYIAELQKAHTEQLTINVLGVVQYETIFGELCESEFWFVRRPVHKFRAKRPENAPSGVALHGTGEEIPASMQRAAVALRTYRRLTSFELLETDEGF